MFRKTLLCLIVLITFALIFFLLPKKSQAIDTSVQNFFNTQAHDSLISDDAFISIDSMTVEQIQQFLVMKNSYLQYYNENGWTAAQIIWDASHGKYPAAVGSANGIDINSVTGTVSPRVILVMLQKEQGLITNPNRDDYGLTYAMGYDCPDSTGCAGSKYPGFSQQVGWGAWQLRYNYEIAAEGSTWWSTHYTNLSPPYFQVNAVMMLYDYTGAYNIVFKDQATAALYRYTPHVFDSAYNFWKFYNDYFFPQISISTTPGSTLTISANGITSSCSENCNYQYPAGTNLTITRNNPGNLEFNNWTGCSSVADPICSITMTDGASVTASYYQSLVVNSQFNSGVGGWDASRSQKIATGDFDGDGGKEIATLYGYDQEQTKAIVFQLAGSNFLPENWWDSGIGGLRWQNIRSVTAGDFNGDGKDDLALVYDYGNDHVIIIGLISTGSTFSSSVWFDSGIGGWHGPSVGNIVAADFNGDGKADLALTYDYGNDHVLGLTLISNGTKFTVQSWFDSGIGGWHGPSMGNIVAGDFNGDGKPDIALMYDYGYDNTSVFVLVSDGTKFTPQTWFSSGIGGWSAIRSPSLISTDFNGDGKPDLGTIYGYNGEQSKFFVFVNNGSTFTPQTWFDSGSGNWAAANSIPLTVADFNLDGKPEITTFYSYSRQQMQILTFSYTGHAYTAP